MSSGSDDRRNDPTMFGGFGAPNQPADQWQRPPDGSAAGQQNPGAPDPTAVWTPGGTGLPPGVSWQGSGPPPGLPDPTQWSPEAPQASWSPAGPQDYSTAGHQADPTRVHNPTLPNVNPSGGQADPTQLRTPAAQWPGANPVGGQADPNQQWGAPPQWGPGQQWNPAVGQPNPGQPWGQPGPAPFGAPAWQQQPVQQQQYGEIPALEHGGAQSYGQGFPPGPPKSGGKAGIWVAVGIAAVLIGGTALTAVAVSRSDDSSGTAAGASATPSMVSALSTTPAPSETSAPKATTTAPTGAAAGQEPVIEGYQVVASPDRGAAYDVPPSWKVASEGTIGGFGEPPGDSVIGKGYATDGRDYCPGSTRTVSLLTGSKLSDHAEAGAELGTKTAPLAYSGSTGTPKPAESLRSMDGKISGMFTETTGTVPDPEPGCASTYSVYTYAFKGAKDGSFVMVMVADTGVPDAIDAATAKRIFSSIRAL
ncbi:hypothetical protein ACFVVM_22995 [Nocardia sp. NPDC058176]|uniref:hypothetical protein n=1 Tax=Nocardia sp. NPDC058176 TaxID=3346368 RepID=UPI0036D984C8